METESTDIRTRILKALDGRRENKVPDCTLLVEDEKLRKCLELLKNAATKKKVYLDVPLTKIVVVAHDGPAQYRSEENESGNDRILTWRVLMGGVTAEGWTQEQLTYLESEVGEKGFNSRSRTALEFDTLGGAVEETNGLHRLTAAVCWLSSKPNGDTAELRKACVTTWTFAPEVQEVFARASAGKWEMLVGRETVCGSERGPLLIRCADASSKDGVQFVVTREGAQRLTVNEQERKGVIQRLFSPGRARDDEPSIAWIRIPPMIVSAIADTKWIADQMKSPRYRDAPSQFRKQFAGHWSETVFVDDGTRVIDDEYFTESHGYNDADRRGIAALGVGETWESDAYGEAHTVTRLEDVWCKSEAADDEDEPSARQRMRP
ncbi:hypothetical protein IAG25_32925 [Caballeronia sp. EK]|uniref:hypothetical protein n=1 Tax=Caballeronia sp. EK TaxID=2767469 RepID=UPI001655DC89|nr:hypothetical protein [Caballeronia sp. EK]MBC8641630.1 hypothetical protein [Caballeronia sp. EK]